MREVAVIRVDLRTLSYASFWNHKIEKQFLKFVLFPFVPPNLVSDNW